MSHTQHPAGTPVPPALSELMARYLERQAAAQAAGLARVETGEVVPFEAAPVQPVDARVAWNEALTAPTCFNPKFSRETLEAPPDWPAVVAAHESVMALAFCTANFPQLVRNLHPLLQMTDLAKLRPAGGQPISVPSLEEWAVETARKKEFPQTLLAVGSLRLARQFDTARAVIEQHASKVPAEWQGAWANEQAALAWHRGEAEEAAALWKKQGASVPVLFNRGMAALFLGQPAEARTCLGKAVAQLPEDGAWHHLGRLYLTLAEMRG